MCGIVCVCFCLLCFMSLFLSVNSCCVVFKVFGNFINVFGKVSIVLKLVNINNVSIVSLMFFIVVVVISGIIINILVSMVSWIIKVFKLLLFVMVLCWLYSKLLYCLLSEL